MKQILEFLRKKHFDIKNEYYDYELYIFRKENAKIKEIQFDQSEFSKLYDNMYICCNTLYDISKMNDNDFDDYLMNLENKFSNDTMITFKRNYLSIINYTGVGNKIRELTNNDRDNFICLIVFVSSKKREYYVVVKS